MWSIAPFLGRHHARDPKHAPLVHKLLQNPKEDVGVEASLMSLVQNHDRVLLQLWLIQQLPQQSSICISQLEMSLSVNQPCHHQSIVLGIIINQ